MTEATEQPQKTDEKLYAGKYKTAEEMEEAIIGKDKEYGKLRQTHDELKKVHESKNNVPENYTVSDDVEILGNEIENIKDAAKNAQLPQEQFEKLTHQLAKKRKAEHDAVTQARKDVGDENILLLEDYVKKTYPEALQKTVLDKLIVDKSAREEALKHRDKLLDNRAPGMSDGNPGKNDKREAYDGQKELMDLAKRQQSAKHDRKLREKLIETAREVGEARYKKA